MARATGVKRKILVTGLRNPVHVPVWARGYKPVAVTFDQMRSVKTLPDITIVRGGRPQDFLAHSALIKSLATMQQHTRRPSLILLEFEKALKCDDPEALARVLEPFPFPLAVELIWGNENAWASLAGALAKLLAVERQGTLRPNRGASDPLAEAKTIIEATADLRSPEGKLSAKRVARVFGISLAELAEDILGRKRQTVAKTEAAESLQKDLFLFEKIARLRAVLDEEQFRSWLRTANRHLENKAPLELIRACKVQAVADLVADMLTGNPS